MTGSAPSILRRIQMLGLKIRERGLSWGMRRLATEIGSPTTVLGKLLRPVVMPFYRLHGRLRHGDAKGVDSDALFFFYDLEISPITYNIVDDLVAAEMMRRRVGAARLHVVIVPGYERGLRHEDADYDAVVNRDARLWRVHHMMVPLFSLMPTCGGYTICASRAEADDILRRWTGGQVYPDGYSLDFPVPPHRRTVFDAARRGEAVFPAFEAPEIARRAVRRWLQVRAGGRRPIVVTLRQYGYMTRRNSRLDDWASFLRGLDPAVYFPVLIPDTESAADLLPPSLSRFAVFTEAAWNVALRLALYEQAWLNMAVVHGPTELCWYSQTSRYLLFMEADTAPQTASALLAADGFQVGGQLPWAGPHQRWVWSGDTQTALTGAFQEMTKAIEATESAEKSRPETGRGAL